MTEEQKQALERQLWNIANDLRGKMDADEFKDYILGFIFYKYLSERQYALANELLETEEVKDYYKVTDKEELNYLDAVIGLPANLFYGTGIPTCILVLKKCRKQDDDILFIDASQHYEKAGNQNMLSDGHVERIIETCRKRETIDKYAYVATLNEVAENDYNLNIPRYVDTFEEEEPVDIAAVSNELKTLEKDMQATDNAIAGYCRELGIESPF